MTRAETPLAPAARPGGLRAWLDLRVAACNGAGDGYFKANARAISACAAAMADAFFEGGTLLILGGGAFATDAQHNAVEYVPAPARAGPSPVAGERVARPGGRGAGAAILIAHVIT